MNILSCQTIRKGKVMLELEWIGEGNSGDYLPIDDEDVPLMRFSVYRLLKGDAAWSEVDAASYCTQVPATVSRKVARKVLRYLLDQVYEFVRDGHSIKKLCERLSWIEPRWVSK